MIDTEGEVGQLITVFIGLINGGAALRMGLLIFHTVHADGDRPNYMAKLKKLLVFVIIANCLLGLTVKFYSYIGG